MWHKKALTILVATHSPSFLQVQVLVGAHDRREPEESIAVSNIALHPSWHPYNGYDFNHKTNPDIAVLTLANPVTFTEKVRPVCLPSDASLSFAGETATAAGWGYTDLNNQGPFGSDLLKKVQVDVISGDQCRAITNIFGSMRWINE